MKKSSFVAMMSGTVSGVLFALGMCMALIPEWAAFRPGLVCGCAGLLMALITLLVWRKMEYKKPIRLSGKIIFTMIAVIAGTLALGVGMCLTMVWGRMIAGTATGLVGILILICLIPLTKGIKE